MIDKADRSQFMILNKVCEIVNSLAGDTSLINDSLYENYLTACLYYDDDFSKTSYFLDCLSNADIRENFIART